MNIFWIALREFRCYFRRPIAYIVIASFIVLSGIYTFVLNPFFVVGKATLQPFFDFLPFLFTLFIPAITMRAIAEEKADGMLEIMQTWPVSDLSWVVGKFLGTLALVTLTLLLTASFPIAISAIGDLDWGAVIGGYLGLILMAAAYISLGIFASAATSNQVIAFINGFLLCFCFYIVGRTATFVGEDLRGMVEFLSFERRVVSMSQGVIDLRDVAYLASIVLCATGLTAERLHLRRWR